MKELLKNYYNIEVYDYYEVSEGFILYEEDNIYYLYRLDEECNIDFVKDIYNYVKDNNIIKLHSIIYNIFNDCVSDGYILMKVNRLICDINYDDVMLFNSINMNHLSNYYIDIRTYWINKIDKLEKEIINYGDDVRYDFYYYMGVIERLISYIELIDVSKLELVLSHKKRYNNTIDYYNPFNLCIDLKYRNIIFYLLSNDVVYKINNYISYVSDYERKYILFSLLIPYDYFDNMDRYVININEYEEYMLDVMDILGYKKRSN